MGHKFRSGQKVMCVKELNYMKRRYPRIAFPTKGTVYVVRALCDRDSRPSITLYEIRNRRVRFSATKAIGEASFREDHFRPVDERQTDISVFTAMLTPAVAKESA